MFVEKVEKSAWQFDEMISQGIMDATYKKEFIENLHTKKIQKMVKVDNAW